MNGNVTKEGIRLDLEWMKRVALGGFQNFDAALFGDTVVEKRVAYMTPEWKDAFRYAIELADRLGLETAIAGSPGWSESGGPWVEPRQAMKKLVWSETTIAGPRRFAGKLPDPPRSNGQIRNMGATPSPQGGGDPTYYADSAVIAYRTPAGEMDAAAAKPVVTTNNGPVDGAVLSGQATVDQAAITGEAMPVEKSRCGTPILHGVPLVQSVSVAIIVPSSARRTSVRRRGRRRPMPATRSQPFVMAFRKCRRRSARGIVSSRRAWRRARSNRMCRSTHG